MLKNKKGFTLIEIMVVVLIIGILASAAIPSYRTSILKTKIVNNMPLMRALQDDIINYYNIHGVLPTKLKQLSINKNEFNFSSDTKAVHNATNCSFELSNDSITENCGENWQLIYTISQSGIGYKASNRIFLIINGSGQNASNLHKIAKNLNWEQTNNANQYLIK